jgi:hypothetical protein
MKLRAYRMAVSDRYPTPWCGWATWEENGVVRGVNCEGHTEIETRQKLKEKVNDN